MELNCADEARHMIGISFFPFSTGLKATLAVLLLGSSLPQKKKEFIDYIPERKKVRFLQDRSPVQIQYWASKEKNRQNTLAVLMPGLGGSSDSGLNSFLGQKFFEWGYSVLAVPNPLNWSYVLGVHPADSYPGHLPEDARVFSLFLKKAIEVFEKKSSFKINKLILVGSSLGGLFLPLAEKEISKRLNLPIVKVVSLHPPWSLTWGAQLLDKMYNLGQEIPAEKQNHIRGFLIGVFEDIFNSQTQGVSPFLYLERKVDLTDRQLRWVIGNQFRKELTNVIYTSQLVNDRNLLATKESRFSRNARMSEAEAIGFQKYLKEIVFENVNRSSKTQSMDWFQFVKDGSFLSIENELSKDSRFIVFHSQDDFLMNSWVDNWFNSRMPHRFFLFEKGGHLGEVWTSEFLQKLKSVVVETGPS